MPALRAPMFCPKVQYFRQIMTHHRPTMKDVAAQAGVSINVVSRVCRAGDNEPVSRAARQRVLSAIKELGYRPDSRARSLRSSRSETLGYYVGSGPVTVDEGFARSIFDGMQEGCGEFDQDLLIFHPMNEAPTTEIIRALTNTKVDGLIYHPQRGEEDLTEALLRSGKPVVRIGEPYPGMPAVVAEDRYGAKRLAYHLYIRGHRRIMFRKESTGMVSAARRYEGFREAAEHLGMTIVATVNDTLEEDLTAEEQELLMAFRTEGITAVACWRDWSASRVLDFCRRRHIHVPEDIAVVGFDGLPSLYCPPDLRLTTIVVDWHRVATIAVATLIDIIREKAVPDETVHTCSLYAGNTT